MSKLLYNKNGFKNPKINSFELLTPDIITNNNTPALLYNHFKNNIYLDEINITASHIKFNDKSSIYIAYGNLNSIAMKHIFPKCPTKLTLNLYAYVTKPKMFHFTISIMNTRLNKSYDIYSIYDHWISYGGYEYRMEKLHRGWTTFSINWEEITLDLKTFLDYENNSEDEHTLSIRSAQNVSGYNVNCAILRKFILDF